MKQTNRQLIDRGLFLYGGLVVFTLTGIAFYNLKSINSLVTLVLFLPVSIYFLIRLFISVSQFTNRAINYDHKRHPYFGNFTLLTFLGQSEVSFLVNLTLIALAISLVLIRISLNILK